MHLVLRAGRARGDLNMLRPAHRECIKAIVHARAAKFAVKIDHFVNVGNHLHMIVISKHRRLFKAFLRTITGLIARLVTGAKKGRKFSGKFWDALAFTRVVPWGRAFLRLRHYLIKNSFEATGGAALRAKAEQVMQNGETLVVYWYEKPA